MAGRAKIIWTYWHQGWEQAPDLVVRCRRSWERLNPGYELRALDQHSLFRLIDLPGIDLARRDLTVQKIAALGRLALLCKYGGVWTDATVYCARPLDSWLDAYYQSAYFTFRWPTPLRMAANWFIAADPDSVILNRLFGSFLDYYANTHFTNQDTPLGRQYLERYAKRWETKLETTIRWHSRFAREVLRVYPYFIYHYTFNRLILTDPACAQAWDRVPPLDGNPPHTLQGAAQCPNGVELARAQIDSRQHPMFKLDWRVDAQSPYWSATLAALENHS